MKCPQFDKKKAFNQSKFTLKKNNNYYLPQMFFQKQSLSNRSKEDALSLRMKELKKTQNETTEMSDLNVPFHQIHRLNTDIRSNSIKLNALKKESQSKSRLIMKKPKGSLKQSNHIMSLRDKSIKPTIYKTQNNSLINHNDIVVQKNTKQALKPKNGQFQLNISLYNPKYSKWEKTKGLNNNNHHPNHHHLIQSNKYVPTSFITFNTQPSSTTHKNNESIKYKNSNQSLQTQTYSNNKNSIEIINAKKDISIQVVNKDKSTISKGDNAQAKEVPSAKRSISSNKSNELYDDALEYDEVKDIIMYNDFSCIDLLNDYLFDEDDYNQYLSMRKDAYLKYFSFEKAESSSPLLEDKESEHKCLYSKSIPIVKLII